MSQEEKQVLIKVRMGYPDEKCLRETMGEVPQLVKFTQGGRIYSVSKKGRTRLQNANIPYESYFMRKKEEKEE